MESFEQVGVDMWSEGSQTPQAPSHDAGARGMWGLSNAAILVH